MRLGLGEFPDGVVRLHDEFNLTLGFILSFLVFNFLVVIVLAFTLFVWLGGSDLVFGFRGGDLRSGFLGTVFGLMASLRGCNFRSGTFRHSNLSGVLYGGVLNSRIIGNAIFSNGLLNDGLLRSGRAVIAILFCRLFFVVSCLRVWVHKEGMCARQRFTQTRTRRWGWRRVLLGL
jgi:hypothetical protein